MTEDKELGLLLEIHNECINLAQRPQPIPQMPPSPFVNSSGVPVSAILDSSKRLRIGS